MGGVVDKVIIVRIVPTQTKRILKGATGVKRQPHVRQGGIYVCCDTVWQEGLILRLQSHLTGDGLDWEKEVAVVRDWEAHVIRGEEREIVAAKCKAPLFCLVESTSSVSIRHAGDLGLVR